jgi:protein-L-isoaspartate O-methyltransferase
MLFLAPLFAFLFTFQQADTVPQADEPPSAILAPYLPTPDTIVERMLRLGQLKAGEKMCDLGSGDGRIVITAAREYHATATGIELDDTLFRDSVERIRKLDLFATAHIIHGDILKQRYSSYDLVTVYMLPETNDLMQPILEREMKHGSRVVAHDFEFRHWRPTKIETVEDDGTGRSHTLFLYER